MTRWHRPDATLCDGRWKGRSGREAPVRGGGKDRDDIARNVLALKGKKLRDEGETLARKLLRPRLLRLSAACMTPFEPGGVDSHRDRLDGSRVC